jgi:hypothetical protein
MVLNRFTRGALALGVGLSLTACDSFFEVLNPDIIEASTVDPIADGPTFSRSAMQNFATAYGPLIIYSAWQTTEGYVGDSFPTRSEFGARRVVDNNGTYVDELWVPLSRSLASSEDVIDVLGGSANPNAAKDINVARAAFSAGYSYIMMAEMFCEGVERGGPALSTAEMLSRAVARFTQAYDVATAAGGTEGTSIANAALVGRARAQLQAGKNAEASADAAKVPATFVYNLEYVDDSARRTRLGNGIYFWSNGGSRESFVVPPAYRAMADAGDTRISYVDAKKFAQDGGLQYYNQTKYKSWSAPVRLASGLEARYIAAEAKLKTGTTADALALIAERRTAGSQPAFAGGDNNAIMAELMAQRSRDFWLEGKRMGDWRRNPSAVPNILPSGPTGYYQPTVADKSVGTQTCWPIPFREKNANPNLKK